MIKLTKIAAMVLMTGALSTTMAATEAQKKSAQPEAKDTRPVLHVYNWPGYISKDVVTGFEKKFNAKVDYQEYDLPSEMHINLLKGKTSSKDVVIMSLEYADKLGKSGFFEPMNRKIVTNAKYLDPRVMRKVASGDPYLRNFVPYMWGTLGIGVNVDLVKKAIGGELPDNKADLIFKRELTSKLKDCGISYMETASDMMSVALKELGYNPDTAGDKELTAASELMLENRQNIKTFSTYPTDMLANGETCVSVGFSGDIIQAQKKSKYNIQYFAPSKGTIMWVDVMGVPKDSPNKDLANQFINYVLEPQVLAANSNDIQYVHGSLKAAPLTNPAMMKNPALNPPSLQQVQVRKGLSASEQRNLQKYYNRVLNQE